MLCDPQAVLNLLRKGDRLARCLPGGWTLVRAGLEVEPGVASALCQGGKLAPAGDGLLPDPAHSQTWIFKGKRRATSRLSSRA